MTLFLESGNKLEIFITKEINDPGFSNNLVFIRNFLEVTKICLGCLLLLMKTLQVSPYKCI